MSDIGSQEGFDPTDLDGGGSDGHSGVHVTQTVNQVQDQDQNQQQGQAQLLATPFVLIPAATHTQALGLLSQLQALLGL